MSTTSSWGDALVQSFTGPVSALYTFFSCVACQIPCDSFCENLNATERNTKEKLSGSAKRVHPHVNKQLKTAADIGLLMLPKYQHLCVFGKVARLGLAVVAEVNDG